MLFIVFFALCAGYAAAFAGRDGQVVFRKTVRPGQPIRGSVRGIDQLDGVDGLSASARNLEDKYPVQTMDMPISHFEFDDRYRPHVNGTFKQQYWFDKSHYKPGGPVICLLGGETDGAGRLAYMDTGILHQLAVATGGVAVVLEHRYYGGSTVMGDLSTANLRFLTTDQAVADVEYFARNVKFDGLDDVSAPNRAAWVVYGGSYAGGMAAFVRTEHPDTIWGAISSSGVTVAIADYWQYNEPIRKFGPEKCISATQDVVEVVDYHLARHPRLIQGVFGLDGISNPADFAATLYLAGVGNWQARNWDPRVSSPVFDDYCSNITSSKRLYSHSKEVERDVVGLVSAAGLDDSLAVTILNLAGFINSTQTSRCEAAHLTQDDCFGTTNPTFYRRDDLSQQWRLWPFQYCTEWGYFQSAASVPQTIRPIVSRSTTVEFAAFVCRAAFGIETMPETDRINRRGGFGIKSSRLAFVDGQADPWRPAGPHSDDQPDRKSTLDQPWILIPGGVHHWDENGRLENDTTENVPPDSVVDAQRALAAAVTKWHQDWKAGREGDIYSDGQ